MKKLTTLLLVLLPSLLAVSCKDNNNPGEEQTGPAVLSVAVKDAQDVYRVPKYQTLALSLSVVAEPVSAESYTITIAASPSLVESYNTANGTSFEILPAEAYSLTSTSVMLTRYSPSSTTCELRLKGAGCEFDKTYILPVAIASVQGGSNFETPDESAAYIFFQMTPAEQRGAGTEADPYIIDGVEAFMKIGKLLQDDATVYFKMENDIDLAEETLVAFPDDETETPSWTPINSGETAVAVKRAVVFDGANHKISNYKSDASLFAVLAGTVKDLTIENAQIECGSDNMGGVLAGYAGIYTDSETGTVSGSPVTIKNVHVLGSKIVNDRKRTGGLVGYVTSGTIEDCDAECDIEGPQQLGGLIGRMDAGTVTGCHASGNLIADTYYSGGLIGYIGAVTVKDCYATGNVESLSNYTRAGGLIGNIAGSATIEHCYATGNVTGQGHMAGGLVGSFNESPDGTTVSISKSYATGNVTLPTSGNVAHAGGLVGTVDAAGLTLNITDCYATGAITVRRYSSGFVGFVFNAGATLNVTNGYTTSDLSGVNLRTHFGAALGNNSGTATYKGFIAWQDATAENARFSYPETGDKALSLSGNYFGNEGTLSAKAKELGWSDSVWDLSKDIPTLK